MQGKDAQGGMKEMDSKAREMLTALIASLSKK